MNISVEEMRNQLPGVPRLTWVEHKNEMRPLCPECERHGIEAVMSKTGLDHKGDQKWRCNRKDNHTGDYEGRAVIRVEGSSGKTGRPRKYRNQREALDAWNATRRARKHKQREADKQAAPPPGGYLPLAKREALDRYEETIALMDGVDAITPYKFFVALELDPPFPLASDPNQWPPRLYQVANHLSEMAACQFDPRTQTFQPHPSQT